MPGSRRLFRGLLAPAALFLAAWGALAALSLTGAWRRLELLGFDALTVLTTPGAGDSPIVIVGIDEPTFAELDLQWPWPRQAHAELIDALSRAGAAVIAFDVVFSEPAGPEEDDALAGAIRRAGNVVLAADLVEVETPAYKMAMRVEPHRAFREAGAMTGMAAVTLDPDAVVRRIPRDPDSFWRQVAGAWARSRGRTLPSSPPPSFIRYLGPGHSIPYVSYYQALDPGEFLPPDTFRGRIVLVGFDVKASPEPGREQADMFATPFLGTSGRRTPGVEVQANLVVGGISGQGLDELPRPQALALAALAMLAAALLMRRWRPIPAAGAALLLLATVAGAAWALFLRGVWIPVAFPLAGVAGVYALSGARAFLSERRQRLHIRQALSRYVSRPVMEEVEAHPETLVLGGVRRELAILFTDLQGFTALAEGMPPERVGELLNRHLTAMTAVILRHGGTVDKFMGDAIIAFWGAPLADADRSRRAVAAACEMLAEMEKEREGDLPLRMRVGIHSGAAVVGNMGSHDRFAYTAIGDAVNLASRLEGANKEFGTRALVSEAVRREAEDGGEWSFREVGRVRVTGRGEPVKVFELLSLEEAGRRAPSLAAFGRGLAAFYAGELAAAGREFSALAGEGPVARAYTARLEIMGSLPPPGWDGVWVMAGKG